MTHRRQLLRAQPQAFHWRIAHKGAPWEWSRAAAPQPALAAGEEARCALHSPTSTQTITAVSCKRAAKSNALHAPVRALQRLGEPRCGRAIGQTREKQYGRQCEAPTLHFCQWCQCSTHCQWQFEFPRARAKHRCTRRPVEFRVKVLDNSDFETALASASSQLESSPGSATVPAEACSAFVVTTFKLCSDSESPELGALPLAVANMRKYLCKC